MYRWLMCKKLTLWMGNMIGSFEVHNCSSIYIDGTLWEMDTLIIGYLERHDSNLCGGKGNKLGVTRVIDSKE